MKKLAPIDVIGAVVLIGIIGIGLALGDRLNGELVAVGLFMIMARIFGHKPNGDNTVLSFVAVVGVFALILAIVLAACGITGIHTGGNDGW